MIKGEEKQYDFEQCRVDIREFLVEKEDFNTSLQMLNILQNKILAYPRFKKFEMWYVLYNSGYCFRQLGMHDKSLELLEQSLKYTNQNEDDSNYLKSLWMSAEIYKFMKNTKSAKRLYNQLISFYHRNNNNIDRILNMLNVCEIDCNIRRIYCLTQKLMVEINKQGIESSNVYKKKMPKQIKDIATKAKNTEKNREYDFYYNKIINMLSNYESTERRKNLLILKSQ